MQIFIKTEQGRNIVLDVEPYDTVKTVKLKIQEKTGIPSEFQILYAIRSSRRLEDEMILNLYGIHNGSTLEIRTRLGRYTFYVIYNEFGDKLDIDGFFPSSHDVNQLKNNDKLFYCYFPFNYLLFYFQLKT
jgi:hypothetical protein